MSDSEVFRDLLCRVRAGDQRAATDLVRRLEPELRRAVRVRLSDPRLRRVVDSPAPRRTPAESSPGATCSRKCVNC